MKPNILVVDDDRELTDLLVDALASRGHAVETASDGESALAAVRAKLVDVVVTDVVMDGMGGLELCKRFLEEQPEVPVVILTALANVDTAVAAIRAGAYDFIAKPINLEEIRVTDWAQDVDLIPKDAGRLFACAAEEPGPLGFQVVYATSKPVHWLRYHLEPTNRLFGFEPQEQGPQVIEIVLGVGERRGVTPT